MDIKEKIAFIRNILYNANNMNMNPEIILKISKEIDKYIVEYYKKYDHQVDGQDEKSYL